MNILITGGAGFIGSTLADKLLSEGHTVSVVDCFSDYYNPVLKEKNVEANLEKPNYRLYRCDICDLVGMREVFEREKFDCVVHIAARAGVRPSLEDPIAYVKTNILGTLNVLQLMKEFGVKKLVFASSSSVYGNCRELVFTENLKVTEPISPYAATKSADEQFIYTYSKLYGIKSVCLRFFTVYGPRQRPDLAISKFTRLILEGKPIPVYGDGTTMRDYTYVDDIVSGICSAISYDKTDYEIINIGGGEPVTLNEMIATIEDELGKKAIIDRQPMQPGDVNKTVCDYFKAKLLLGYEAKTSFREGIHKFVQWFRSQQQSDGDKGKFSL